MALKEGSLLTKDLLCLCQESIHKWAKEPGQNKQSKDK